MRVLVACEFSGVVREAFRRAGHDAWSCDLIPAADGSPNHYQRDVLEVIHEPFYGDSDNWDMLLAFPPCTYLCSSGLHWNKRRPGRELLTWEALNFVRFLADSGINRIAIENPIGCLSSRWRKPDQIIQPHQFGHPESKATCLWLYNLPPLTPTDILPLPTTGRWDNQTPSGQNKLGPSPERAKKRSITYPGIAQAMADQWGVL